MAGWRRWSWMAVVVLLAVYTGELVGVARGTSANWDEPHHLYDGYNIWTRGDYRLNAEVPPLVKMAAALPLLPMHLVSPPSQDEPGFENAFRAGRAFVFSNGGDRVLLPARLVCIVWALALAGLVYVAAGSMFGAGAGLAALALFVFDPLVVAHGSLVNTDVASALFLFGGVWAFYRYVERPGWGRLLVAGLVAGLAMVAKFTGLLIAPMLVAVCVVEGARRRNLAALGRGLVAVAAVGAIGWGVVWGFYGFRWAAAPGGLDFHPGLGSYVASVPNPKDAGKLLFAAKYHLLPEAYLWGLANTKKTEWEYTSYFLGRVLRHGPWQYFPVAFLVKSTVPLMALLALAPVVLRRGVRRSSSVGLAAGPAPAEWAAGWAGPSPLTFLLVPVAVYFAVIVTSHFDIGARHLMPVYPFLYVLAGAVVGGMLKQGRGWTVLAGVLVAWQVGTSLRVAPVSYMAYGNEMVGGPLGVRRYLSDANVDWGQQLKSVKRYLEANHVAEQDCWFGYFPDGAVEPQDYGVRCRRLPTPSGLGWLHLPMEVPETIEGTVLLSESVLDGVESGDGPLNPYREFQGMMGAMKPVAVIDDGVYVYKGRFHVSLAAAWTDVRRSGELAKAGDRAGALALAQEAVRLAPDQAGTQLNLGELLAVGGDKAGAAEHFREAQRWLEANRPELEREEYGPGIEAGLRGVTEDRR